MDGKGDNISISFYVHTLLSYAGGLVFTPAFKKIGKEPTPKWNRLCVFYNTSIDFIPYLKTAISYNQAAPTMIRRINKTTINANPAPNPPLTGAP